MDKNTATNLIESTFNQTFDETRFELFAKNFLNDVEPKSNHYSGQYIWDDYKEHVNTYKRIGKYTDPDGEALDILIVEVKSVLKLERARTALRNFVIKHLVKFEKDYALVAFYSKQDDGADWRFSFIKLEHQAYVDEEKGKVKTRKEFTPAKRYSFLVGKYEKAYTAKNQLLPLLQNVSSNATIEEIESAFSIEKVTDEFFGQYKDLFVKLYEHFENDTAIQNELVKSKIDTSRFTKKLLGQIVFLYFLQKKGWLGVPKDKTWGNGEKHFIQKLFETSKTENKNFFKDYLQFLFYEALAKERDNENSYYQKFDCRIPFLNGGLFEAEYDWKNANISIPETIFRNTEKNKSGDTGTGILDVFDRYNFTIKEDEPLDKEVAVDPEMLGKVFENMLEISERKSKGAFYTPREIVHYMCQESLIHYLDNSLNNYTETFLEIGNSQTNMFGNEGKKGQHTINLSHQDIKVPKTDIENFIRNGHFALEHDQRVVNKGKETPDYKFILPESIRQHADLIDKKLTEIKICDPAIGSGAFPVGLLHELVNAHLVIKPHLSPKYLAEKLKAIKGEKNGDELSESRYIYRLKRHIIQESIYGVDIDASAIDIARLRLWLSLVVDEDDFEPIETLPNLDYKIVCGNSLLGFPENWKSPAFDKIEELKDDFFNETNHDRKKELKVLIDNEIKARLDSSKKVFGYKIDFDFKLFFSEVWREKGGFDIVIGNPPYVNIANIKDGVIRTFLKTKYQVARNKSDLYSFFTEKGFRICRKNATLYFIVSNSWLGIDSFLNFRKFLIENTKIIDLVKCNGNVFDATVTPVIFGFKKESVNEHDIPMHLLIDNSFVLLPNKLKYSNIKKLPSFPFSFDQQVTFTIPVVKLGSIAHFTLGIKTSDDSRFISDSKKDNDSYRLIRGKDVSRWKIKYANKWLWYKPGLMSEKKGAGPRKIEYFITEKKIVIKDVAKGIEAAIDNSQYLTNDTLNSIYKLEQYSFEYILSILNSELINVWYSNVFSSGLHIKLNELREVPIAIIDKKVNSTIDLVANYIGKIKDTVLFSFFSSVLNGVIYELYFPAELKSANKEIIKHLGNLKPINDSMSDEEKLAVIQSEFERLYDPNHPVRNNLETLDSIEEVRIIKEALK